MSYKPLFEKLLAERNSKRLRVLKKIIEIGPITKEGLANQLRLRNDRDRNKYDICIYLNRLFKQGYIEHFGNRGQPHIFKLVEKLKPYIIIRNERFSLKELFIKTRYLLASMLNIYKQILNEGLINDLERVEELENIIDITQIYEFYHSISDLFE
ncbi:MAG: hypothetical protein ACTSRP_17745 [Candidatus Helarchaeota archaeon]